MLLWNIVCVCTRMCIFLSHVLSAIMCFQPVGSSVGDRVECSLSVSASLLYTANSLHQWALSELNMLSCMLFRMLWPFCHVFCVTVAVLSPNTNKTHAKDSAVPTEKK